MREARLVALLRLGRGARVGRLVPGVARRGRRVHEVWLGAVWSPDGRIYRITVGAGAAQLEARTKLPLTRPA
jgi:hypothetical protein